MGRKRKTHKSLPERVYIHHGSYRYVPKHGKRVVLAKVGDYGGMLRKLGEVIDGTPDLETMGRLFDRYLTDVVPGKAATTQADNSSMIKNLRKSFGQMAPNDLRQPDAARYRDARGRKFPTAANREIELLSHVCTMAVEWGAMSFHPLKGLRKIKRPPRQRYVTDTEYAAVHSLASPMVRCVLDLALLTGLRRGDIFRLERSGMSEAGIEIRTSKTGAPILFEWTPALQKVVDDALQIGPRIRRFVVCNRKGEQYTKNGFDAVWSRLMAKATDPEREGCIERFQFRDLRRKSASDEVDELIAQRRLGHASVSITNRVYRVKANKVRPLR